jgi:hypothetical protein
LKFIVQIFLIYAVLELLIYKYIKNLSKKIKWILIKKKLISVFNEEKFKNFKKYNYNYFLGWDKKPNSSNFDLNNNKKVFYSFDKEGFRKSKFNKKKNFIATFGDSYTFCRQVSNSQTWQEIISSKIKNFVSNYGVGNYGLDQSFLKYKVTKIKKETKIVIFGFVPETICRIQSCWKYYLEFGNVHGFKPFCFIKNNKIIIHNNILKKNSKFTNIKNVITKSKAMDRFYYEKYSKYIFKFSYILSFIKNFFYNINIFYMHIKFLVENKNKKNPKVLEDYIFPVIMKKNITTSHLLYLEKYSKYLLEKLIEKISTNIKKDKKCYFVIFPQLFDLKLNSRKHYRIFFNKLKNKYNIIDLTNNFLKIKDYKKFFINDKYGGHLNYKGNLFVANILKDQINY